MNIAFDFHEAGVIDRDAVLTRVEADMLVQLLAPIFDAKDKEKAKKAGRVLGKGTARGARRGVGCDRVHRRSRGRDGARRARRCLLVRAETSPEDLAGMVAAVGILTSRGGMTSHAAVVARGMGKPCVVGAEAIQSTRRPRRSRPRRSKTLKEGDAVSIDGATGEVILGALDPHPSEIQQVSSSAR